MGKTSKEKKLERQAEVLKANQLRDTLKALQEEEDMLKDFAAFKSYDRNGFTGKLVYTKSLQPTLLEWALTLTRTHMKDMYEQCPGWGWNENKKKRELASDEARYIIVYTPDDVAVGFIHFRFEDEHGEPVLYVYEIQVDQKAQGKGVGRFLMQVVELMSRKHGLPRIMLTVFNTNTAAKNMYQKLGYLVDESSPTEDLGYEILSKKLPLPPQKKQG